MAQNNSHASGNNLNVEYLTNGIYDNELTDAVVNLKTTSLQQQEFKFSKTFTESNAIKDLQSDSNYTNVIKNLSCGNMDSLLKH